MKYLTYALSAASLVLSVGTDAKFNKLDSAVQGLVEASVQQAIFNLKLVKKLHELEKKKRK